jgi:hypothetical protein
VLLRAQGTVTAEGLRQAHELGFVARLARDFTAAPATHWRSASAAARRSAGHEHLQGSA